MNKKKLVIVTSDMGIETVMLIDPSKYNDTIKAVKEAEANYYDNTVSFKFRQESFDEVLSAAMAMYGIDFEIIEYDIIWLWNRDL